MPLVDQSFAATFTFDRGRAARVRDPAGIAGRAEINVPRFDHDIGGQPRGLIVEGRPEFGHADHLAVVDGDWNVPRGTVLHEIETPAGKLERRAWYAQTDARGTVNACLNAKGRHRVIAYVPGYLRNRGGFVRWRDRFWSLGAIILAEPGVAVGAATYIPLLEG